MKVKINKFPRGGKGLPEKILIEGDHIKLDSLLKLASAAGTGGEAKIIIQSGEVKVNGETCFQRGKKIAPGDRVETDGRVFEVATKKPI